MDNSASIQVPIFVESRYKVNRRKIKKTVEQTIRGNGVVGNVEVSVAIVGSRKMKQLNFKYRGLDRPTNVLSFSQTEGEFTPVPNDTLYLGDVVIAYPVIIEEAARENMLVDDKIDELVAHGVKHLLGQHH